MRTSGERTDGGGDRRRFNLLANFMLSEIVLTHPEMRGLVINKFIRMAWVLLIACDASDS